MFLRRHTGDSFLSMPRSIFMDEITSLADSNPIAQAVQRTMKVGRSNLIQTPIKIVLDTQNDKTRLFPTKNVLLIIENDFHHTLLELLYYIESLSPPSRWISYPLLFPFWFLIAQFQRKLEKLISSTFWWSTKHVGSESVSTEMAASFFFCERICFLPWMIRLSQTNKQTNKKRQKPSNAKSCNHIFAGISFFEFLPNVDSEGGGSKQTFCRGHAHTINPYENSSNLSGGVRVVLVDTGFKYPFLECRIFVFF